MKFTSSLAAVCLLGLPSALQAQTAAPAAKPMLFEAEFPRANGDVVVKKDPGALGGKYAMHPRDYNPVFVHDTPASGNEITVWVRYRGTTLQMKTLNEEGEQTEVKWLFDKPTNWEWHSFGTFARKKLQHQILIIRGTDAAENAGVDAVIFSPDDDFDPNKEKDLAAFRQAE